MKRILVFLLCSSLSLALTGCAYKIQQARALNPAVEFNQVNLPDVKVDAAAAPDKIPPPYMVTIYKPALDPAIANAPNAPEYADLLFKDLQETVLVKTRKSFVLTADGKDADLYKSLGRKVYEVRSSVTRLETGRGWLRYFVGFGAGDVKIQWEGTVVDPVANKTIVRFVIGDRTGGDPNMAWNVKVFSDRYTMKKALKHLVQKFVDNVQPFL